MKKGIDISKHQGTVNFKNVCKYIDFAILRSSYRTTTDQRFFEYVKGCKENNIPIVGVYHFIYALSKEAAVSEAKFCIEQIRKAGLGKDIIVFADFEYDSVKKAAEAGVKLGKNECNEFTRLFCEYVESQGYKAGIYCNIDYYKNWYNHNLLNKYIFWFADYNGEADYKCDIHQYTNSGMIDGINGKVDMDYYFDKEVTTMSNRQKTVEFLKKYLGIKEGSKEHKEIISIFNESKLCTRYKMTVNDSWCATAVSAAFIATKQTDIFPCVECSCQNMIEKAKKAGIWVENDAFVPNTGDVIMYDWQDNGVGDNTGWADHVGIVVSVDNDVITVIEGNKNDSVEYRKIKVNGKTIRGFITPKYAKEAAKANEPIKNVTAKGPDKNSKWIGKVMPTWLNVRKGAGSDKDKCVTFGPLKKGTKIDICDTVKDSKGADWYYIKYDGKYGYVKAEYVEKV